MLNALKAIVENAETELKDELLAFIDKELALLEKRAVKKADPEKAERKTQVLKILTESVEPLAPAAITEKYREITGIGLTTQKIVPILKELLFENAIVRNQKGKVVTYGLV